MKKRIVGLKDGDSTKPEELWLDLEAVAEIEITSEDPEHPIDSAICDDSPGSGWHASNPGEQLIRICFLEPQQLKRIRVVFEEDKAPRTQEFVLRWAGEKLRRRSAISCASSIILTRRTRRGRSKTIVSTWRG